MPRRKSWRRSTLYGELMSRIGKQPIEIPSGVSVELKGQNLKVKGSLGELEMELSPEIEVKVNEADKQIVLINDDLENRQKRQMHGTMRALINNMVQGVSKGFEKKMEVYGMGTKKR